MKKYVVERNLPGACNLSRQELQSISQTLNEVIFEMKQPYYWIQSFVTEDKIYCILIAENAEAVRKHARLANFPVNRVTEVMAIIDPMTGNYS